MATHSSTLAWKIPRTEEPGGLQSMGLLRVGTTSLSLSLFTLCIGEGNGNPLQCSCLENPRDGRAWWAAVYGVAQSWTRLKRLSSSSSSSSNISLNTNWVTVSDFAFCKAETLNFIEDSSCFPCLCGSVTCCISFSACVCTLSCVQLFVIPRTVARQASLFMEFFRQESCSELPFPPPGDLLDTGIEPATPASPALASEFFTTVPPGGPVFPQACIRKKNCDLAKILVHIFIVISNFSF